MTTRRGFFRLMGCGLLMPVAPSIFLPPLGGWRPDTPMTATEVLRNLARGPSGIARIDWEKAWLEMMTFGSVAIERTPEGARLVTATEMLARDLIPMLSR